jgi:phospholipid/cholesterol/gamma-HCH transport system substrate-binding protein
MSKPVKERLTAIALLIILASFSLAVGTYLVVHQRIHPPSWVPIVGERDFILKARITGVAGVLPGQDQAVTISGVRVGDVAGVALDHGLAVATMRIQPRYGDGRIYPNATILMRPKTGLKDMIAELDPGSPRAGAALHSGAMLSSANTLPTVDLAQILAALDLDSRQSLMLLVGNAGQAFGAGGGQALADTFRRFQPLSRDVATASRLVAVRHAELRHLMGNLSKIATELGSTDGQLTEFVLGNAGVFRRFASQDVALRQTIGLLPGALHSTNSALAKATGLGNALRDTLGPLDPSARALGPTLRALRPFFNATTPVFANQLRPFAVAAQPTSKLLAPAAHNLAAATPRLTTLATELDNIVNELAYKPPRQPGYLFYVPWANHNTNSVLSSQDGVGPLRRGLILFSCGSLQLLQDLAAPKRNPTLSTLIQLLTVPDFNTVCKVSARGTPRR